MAALANAMRELLANIQVGFPLPVAIASIPIPDAVLQVEGPEREDGGGPAPDPEWDDEWD